MRDSGTVRNRGSAPAVDELTPGLTCTGMHLSPLSVMMGRTTAVTRPPTVVPHTAAERRASARLTATRSPGGSR